MSPARVEADGTLQAMPGPLDGASILFLNRFYWPDVAATAQQLTDLAEDLAARGLRVTVIAGRGAYDGSAAPLPREEWRNGVRVLRVSSGRGGRHRLGYRLIAYLRFASAAAFRLLRVPKPDVVVALSDPPFLSSLALLCRVLRGSRAVYYVQDLYPELAATLGVLDERGLVDRVASRTAAFLNRRYDAVIALGPRMAERLIASGARPERTAVCPNWADTDSIVPLPHDENPFRATHDLVGRFVVQYSGNAGRAHIFDAVLDAAARLLHRDDIVFLFIGGGKRMPEIQAEARARALRNVRFLDYQPRDSLRFSLSAADASLVTENPEVVGMLVPSKTYGILASGRPLVFIGAESSDVAALVRETGSGYVVSPEDGAGLAALVERLAGDTELVASLGRRARLAAETVYSRKARTAGWWTAVSSILADR